MNVRLASPDELEAILDFGARCIPDHYGPLLGPVAAREQFDDWWTPERMSPAISEGRVVVAVEGFREVSTVEHPDPTMAIVWFERSLD